MIGRMMIVTLQLGLGLLLPAMSQGNDLNRTDQPQTIRILIEDSVDRQTAMRVSSGLFQTALQNGFDVSVRAMGSLGTPDWSPSKPLSLSDFKKDSLTTKVFGNAGDAELALERNNRFQLAIKEIDAYFAHYGVRVSGCATLLPTGEQLANEDFPFNVVVLGASICSSPRVTIKLPPNRRLVVLLTGGTADDNPCAAVAQEQRLRAAFPRAVVTPVVNSDTLSKALLSGLDDTSSRLVVRGCDDRRKPKAMPSDLAPREQAPSVKSMDKRLHIISPREAAKVPRLVPFQGDGAAPHEQVFPVVCVGDECFPQQPVMADEKGSFDGVIIIGRPWIDCGQRYEFRVFTEPGPQLTVGKVIGSWPKAGASSVSVDLVRAEECGTRE